MAKSMQLKSFALIAFLSVAACATANQRDPNDPLEPFNRQMFQLNHDLDDKIFHPLASLYQKIVPAPLHKGISNAFSNINDVSAVANDVLQAKLYQAMSDTWRVAINSTIGLAGTVDVATDMGIPKHTQDFGLTLSTWGWKNSTYIVLPILGPSTFRDAIGQGVHYYGLSVYPYIKSWKVRFALLTLRAINFRANLLGTESIVDAASLDQYVFYRDAYLQRRQGDIAANDHPITFQNALRHPMSKTVDGGDAGAKNSVDVLKQIENGQLSDN